MKPSHPATPNCETLDDELARWLLARTTLRASFARTNSPLDGAAMALRRVRATLGFISNNTNDQDTAMVALVARAYRWAIRIARELELIERQHLDALAEWQCLEAFAPFALAFFDTMLEAPFTAAGSAPDALRLRREIDGVLAPISIAMASSSIAA